MEKLNAMGNPLDKLSKAVDFEMFRDTLERGFYKEKFTKVGEKHFGYKNHTKVDKGSKFIKKGVKRVMRKFGMKDKVIIKSRKIQKTDRTKRIFM